METLAEPMRRELEQDDLPNHPIIRLLVEAPDEVRATIERDLELYGLVVAEKMVPEELLPDPMDVRALRHKLDLTQTELRMTREHLLSVQRSGQHPEERIAALGTDVAEFRQLIGAARGPGE